MLHFLIIIAHVLPTVNPNRKRTDGNAAPATDANTASSGAAAQYVNHTRLQNQTNDQGGRKKTRLLINLGLSQKAKASPATTALAVRLGRRRETVIDCNSVYYRKPVRAWTGGERSDRQGGEESVNKKQRGSGEKTVRGEKWSPRERGGVTEVRARGR